MGRLEHVPSGIPGFDLISNGGLVRGRSTLTAGSAGSGKTIFGVQFLVSGAIAGVLGSGHDALGGSISYEPAPD